MNWTELTTATHRYYAALGASKVPDYASRFARKPLAATIPRSNRIVGAIVIHQLQPRFAGIVLFLSLILGVQNSWGYSVLTHEELIDLAWNPSIRPLLLARFPATTEAQLREAQAYAYGGSAIQDMGYYPFGKRFISNLMHYVRSGDFVAWLLRNARTVDEYAFAVGALSHYLGDSIGHSEAINPATGVEFPELERKFGPIVTYGESPHGHIRTEFAYDVEHLGDSAFAPPSYLHFIGFKVPQRFLERAFISTYGLDIHEELGRARPALRSYRTSVRSFIPAFTEAEIVLHRHQFPAHPDNDSYRTFADRVERTNYERKWRHPFRGPGFKAHLLAILVFIIPKVGAASDLAIKIPTPTTEEWYLRSVSNTVDQFREILDALRTNEGAPVTLPNIDLDTGDSVKPGKYPPADQTYVRLLATLSLRSERTIPETLKGNVLEYFAGLQTAGEPLAKQDAQLTVLRSMKVSRQP